MIFYLLLLVALVSFAHAQLTPLLVGVDVFTPPFTFCNKPDVFNFSIRISQCDLFRSIACNTTNNRCALNPNYYNDTTANNTFVVEMIKFTIVQTWAALMPKSGDGRIRVNVQFNYPNPFFLNGFLQVWQKVPNTPNVYNFTLRQYELRTVDAPTNQDQTYTFNGLDPGEYIFVYWDNGGTKLGNALPEYSQPFYIPQIYSSRISFSVRAIPMLPNNSALNFDTNYQRGNKNYISLELIGPVGFKTLLTNAEGPGYNRKLFWEYRTEQGNIINAKTELETIPPQATSAGFVETMFKFKIFPTMCCSKMTSITARLVYIGLFPRNYNDYFLDRQRYGYGTVLAKRKIAHQKHYLEDDLVNVIPGTNYIPGDPNSYQAYIQSTFGIPNNHPFTVTPGVYVCIKDTPVLNTLTLNGDTYTYRVTTLKRNYCECLNRWNGPGFETPALCNYARNQREVAKAPEAFKTPIGSNTNNFDQYEDYLATLDYPDVFTEQKIGGWMGRIYRLDVDFTDLVNTNSALDYSCNPFTTTYSQNFEVSDGKTVFSVYELTKEDVQRVYRVPDTGACNVGGTGSPPAGQVTYGTGVVTTLGLLTDVMNPLSMLPLYNFIGSIQYSGLNPCTCLWENGFYLYRNQPSPCAESAFQFEYNNVNAACATSVFPWAIDFFDISNRMCANMGTSSGDLYVNTYFGAPVWSGGRLLKPYYQLDWRSNLRPQQYQFERFPSSFDIISLPNQNIVIDQISGSNIGVIYTSSLVETWNYCRRLQIQYSVGVQYDISCISYEMITPGTSELLQNLKLANFILNKSPVAVFNKGISSQSLFPYTQNTPFSFVYNGQPPPLNPSVQQYEIPTNQGVYGTPNLVFGTTGLDTFISTIRHEVFDPSYDPSGDPMVFQLINSFPTYSRFKIIPEIEFYEFLNVDAGIPGIRPKSIDIVFRVSCPFIDLDDTLPYRGYCAQNWIITNQMRAAITIKVIKGPSFVSEPQIPSYFPNSAQQVLLGDVIDSAIMQVRILYNAGDVLSWYFFPKTEPQKQAGNNFCGANPAWISPLLVSQFTVAVPTQSIVMQPMIFVPKAVPPACEYNQPEMLFSVFRGQCFAYEAPVFLDLASTIQTGSPLDYGRYTNYWYDVNLNGVKAQGMSLYSLLYVENTFVTVYDQVSFIANVPVPPPITIANYTNPMKRATSCLDDVSQAICYTPDDGTEDTSVSGITQWHYFANGLNQLYLAMNFVMNANFTVIDNIGAYYCNQTTEFVDVFIWEIQNKPLFAIIDECIVTATAWYTYTVKYGKSIQGLTSNENYPCFERFIAFAIILSNFTASPGPITRIANCTDVNNCCYNIDFEVTANTAVNETFINMQTCTRPECDYELKISPMPNNTWGGLCLGTQYTFTFQSPEAKVQARTNQNNLPFRFPWRGPAILVIPIPAKGFGFVPVQTTNGNCEEEGSFVDIDFTYTDPICTNQIYFNNSNPECAYNVLMAIEPINNAVTYTQTQARLNNPFWLSGNNIPVYNILNSIKFPEILNDPNFLSIPDGSYRLYLWLTPGNVNLPFATVASINATNTVIVEFAAFFNEVFGLSIIRKSITVPRCAATAADFAAIALLPPSEQVAAKPRVFITMTITIVDQAFNGPYNLTFLSPSGALIEQVLLQGIVVCAGVCDGFFPINNNQSCAACDEFMRSEGFDYTLYVGTGIISAGESGLYFVRVFAVETVCVATYPEFITALNTFSTSLNCRGPQCSGRQDGLVRSYTQGGTVFPFLLSDFVQNADRTVAVIRYNYNWTVFTLNGTFLVNYTNVLYIPFVTSGIYHLEATDYNDCKVNATCVVEPEYDNLEFVIVGSTGVNCTGEQGAITVAIVNKTNYPPPPYTLYKVAIDATPVMTTNGYLLTDTTVRPGEEFLYIVCATIGCCSQALNLSIAAPAGFEVRIVATISPCSATSPTGELVAVPFDSQGNPIVGGVLYQWFFNDILLGVTGNTVSGASPGVYRVVATNILGCTSSETAALFAVNDIAAPFERTPVDVNPGQIAGSITGGNGFPYTIELFPNIPPNDINEVVVVSIQQSAILTTFLLSQVPSQATILMRVTDKAGCQAQFELTGGRIPDTLPIISPSVSPIIIPVEKVPYNILPVLMAIMCVMIMGIGLLVSWMRRNQTEKIFVDKFKAQKRT